MLLSSCRRWHIADSFTQITNLMNKAALLPRLSKLVHLPSTRLPMDMQVTP